MLTLLWPWLLALLPLPWLTYRFLPRATREETPLHVPFYDQLTDLGMQEETAPGRSRRARLLLLALTWVLLLLAAARPQWVGEPVRLPVSGRDLLLAVDISGSMAQEDMILHGEPLSRIQLVKKVANEFIDQRIGDRIGLLLFGTQAYVQVPLTFDRQTVKSLFNEAQIGFAGKKTSLGDAIGLAVKRLRERPAPSRVLLLLTDGANTAGKVEPLQAAKLAAQAGVTIYTIGVGADEVMIRTFFGTRRVNPSADLDEETLGKIAELTKGRYFRARSSEELEKIYQLIDKLEPVADATETFRPRKALYHWPLAGALAVSFLLAATRLIPAGPWREKSGAP